MAAFRPFRGWRYNPEMVGDVASVVCPPYDLIDSVLQKDLCQLSPYNVVRLELGETLESDDKTSNRYTRAAALFDDWSRRRVLVRDRQPSYYLLRYGFHFKGQAKARLSLMGRLRLADYERRVVLPHEFTSEPPVLDRLSLMEACNANFSPIMGLYRDSARQLTSVFDEVMAGIPAVRTQDRQGQDFTLWKIVDPGNQDRIGRFFDDRAVYVADGHHRYEAALRFRDRRAEATGSGQTPQAHVEDIGGAHQPFDYVMMALIEFDDPGLIVLPYHRVVGGLAPSVFTRLRDRLHRVFEIQRMDFAPGLGAEGILQRVEQHGRKHSALGLVGPEGEGPYLLTLRAPPDLDRWGPVAAVESWVLEQQVLRPVLGDTLDRHLTYIHDHHQAMERVSSGDGQMAFLLNPFPMGLFESIVGSGQRLPPKSTFFYPKLPTGLVINQLD